MGKFQDEARVSADRLGRSEEWVESEPCTDTVSDNARKVGAEIPNNLVAIVELLGCLRDHYPPGTRQAEKIDADVVRDANAGIEVILDLCRRMRGGK